MASPIPPPGGEPLGNVGARPAALSKVPRAGEDPARVPAADEVEADEVEVPTNARRLAALMALTAADEARIRSILAEYGAQWRPEELSAFEVLEVALARARVGASKSERLRILGVALRVKEHVEKRAVAITREVEALAIAAGDAACSRKDERNAALIYLGQLAQPTGSKTKLAIAGAVVNIYDALTSTRTTRAYATRMALLKASKPLKLLIPRELAKENGITRALLKMLRGGHAPRA